MGVYGLLGEKLGYSFSVPIHARLGCEDYRLFELAPADLADFCEKRAFAGLNVTIPYKREILKYLDGVSPEAAAIGAVNTVVCENGRLVGYNTDVYGFRYLLRQAGISLTGRKLVLLGSGGASLTVQYAAKALGAGETVVISRRGEDNYENLERHSDAEILVNATPVGMYPGCPEAPLDPVSFPRLSGVIDLIYNPARTGLLLDAEMRGIPYANGLSMLVAQAKQAEEIFTGRAIPEERIGEICRELAFSRENLVLIGMPGAGKTAVSKALARLSGRPVYDMDLLLAQRTGMSIQAFFARYGEKRFRELEHALLCELGKKSGVILDCGGGVVTREDNRFPLRQNGRVYQIERRLELLATEGRPLSKDLATVRALAEQRAPLYADFRDILIENNDTAETAAARIWRDFCEAFGR